MLTITIDMSGFTREEREVFADDLRDIIHDERRNAEDAQRVLMSRIGGAKNLRSYVDTLMASRRLKGVL